jgi:hypothetical protein
MMMCPGMCSKCWGRKSQNNDTTGKHRTEKWLKNFTKFKMITSKKKPKTTKCSDHSIISLIAHTAKIVARILKRGIERTIEGVLGEHEFGFRREKGNNDQFGMLTIITEQTLGRFKQLCAY